MKQCTVRDIYAMVNGLAPFDTALPDDHVGLLVGAMDRPVDTVLTALDATPGVVAEAKALGAQLLVTHHPVLFDPIDRLDEAEPEPALVCDMVRAGVSMIAAHTNLDGAPGGVSDTLADQLGWQVTQVDALLRLGSFPAPRTLAELAEGAARALDTQIVRFGAPDRAVTTFAICAGAGGWEVAHAAKLGAQVLMLGEIKHAQALEAMQRGMAVLSGGHRETEICAPGILAKHLQQEINALQYKVRVFVSEVNPFG